MAALKGLPIPTEEPQVLRDQVGDGYGATTAASREAIRLAARSEGLLLDPVYSGKALAGLMGLKLASVKAKAIVFLATGGTPALFTSRYEDWLAEANRSSA